jgi:CDP-archaeol synthase
MSAHALAMLQSLILVSAANGAPLLLARLVGARFAYPMDGRMVLRDAHPLFGRSKTWRGVAATVLVTACAAVLMSLPRRLGALAAASAMAGDCLSSFLKRRFGLEPSSMTLGVDQVPESLFPAFACGAYLPLRPVDVALIVLVVSGGELAMSRLFFAVGLRDRPY